MPGREDYDERRQARIDRLHDAAYSASKESNAQDSRSHNLVKNIPLGQPNINGALTSVLNKSRKARENSLKAAEKSEYYAEKAQAAENNTAISSDDPHAIEKLKAKIEMLEAKRDKIKEYNKQARKNGTEPAPWYELPYLGRDIKAAKDRIAKLEQVDAMPAELIPFDGGEIESDPDTNRIIIRFDERPDDDMIEKLKSNGFRWAPSVEAWQTLRNSYGLYKAKKIVVKEQMNS